MQHCRVLSEAEQVHLTSVLLRNLCLAEQPSTSPQAGPTRFRNSTVHEKFTTTTRPTRHPKQRRTSYKETLIMQIDKSPKILVVGPLGLGLSQQYETR